MKESAACASTHLAEATCAPRAGRDSAKPWRDDYAFADERLRLVSCRAVIDDDIRNRSDHAPVAAILEAT